MTTNVEMFLAGAVVERIEALPYVALVRLRAQAGQIGGTIGGSERLLVIVAAGRGAVAAGRGAGPVPARPRPAFGSMGGGVGLLEAATRAAAKANLRGIAKVNAPLERARVAGLGIMGIALLAHDALWAVAIERGRVVVRPGTLAGPLLRGSAVDRHALLARGEALFAGLTVESLERSREALVAALERAEKRVLRRAAAIEQDLARIDEADALSSQAQWLVAEAARAPRGARSLTVTDWSTGEPRPIQFPLDPARSAREQVDALFKRARRIKRGAFVARGRLAQATERGRRIATLLGEARQAESHDALDELEARGRAQAPGDFVSTLAAAAAADPVSQPSPQFRRLSYRTFHAISGARILVGRGASDNDELTLHVARPQDMWLHARGQAGAHVIVPLDKGHTCPKELLLDAAHLAAHFSDARGEGISEIEYTPRRYVRKPRGFAPGLVVVEREKVLTLRTDAASLARLIASETDSRGERG